MPDSTLSLYPPLKSIPQNFAYTRPVMDPAAILISDDEEVDVVVISSDEDDDCEKNLNHQDDVVLISDDDMVDQLEETDIQEADKASGCENCDDKVDCLHKGSKDLPELSLDECKLYLRKYRLRPSGTKEECMQRIIEHARLIGGEGVSFYPLSSFFINCTGDACKGDIVMFKQNIHDSQRKIVARTVAGRIVGERFRKSNQQPIFSIEVLWSEPIKNLNPLSILVLKGPKLYKFGTFRQPWTSELERSEVLRKKYIFGNAARQKRKLRQTHSASGNNKGKKRQKLSHREPFQSKQPTQIDKHYPKIKDADSVVESTSTHERKAVTVRFPKTKLKRLKDGRVNSLYPRSSFSINCTGDACKGDVVLFKLDQSIKRRVGRIRTLAGRIVKESYGASRQQHTFTVEVLWTKHFMNPPSVSTMFVRGCNLYRFGTFRQPWKNEEERLEVLAEKHKRGEAARNQRKSRLAQIASTDEKGGKPQKASRIVKLKLSKRGGATIAKPHKRKSTQPARHTNSNPYLSKQPTRINKQKNSKRRGLTRVKERKVAHKRQAVRFHRMELNRSTQPTFNQDLNPNPNCFMYSDHNLQEASSSFHYVPNHSMYSHHHLQDPSLFLPYGPALNLWSSGYGQYNHEQWGPNNVLYQPPGQYHYNYGQPGYYHHNFGQPVPRYWFG